MQVRDQLQRFIDRRGLPDARHPRRTISGRRWRGGEKHDRDVRKELSAGLSEKRDRRIPDGDDHVEVHAGVLAAQVVAYQGLVGVRREAIGLECLGIQVDSDGTVLPQVALEGRVETRAEQRVESEPVQHQDAPRRLARGRVRTPRRAPWRTPRSPRWHDERRPRRVSPSSQDLRAAAWRRRRPVL